MLLNRSATKVRAVICGHTLRQPSAQPRRSLDGVTPQDLAHLRRAVLATRDAHGGYAPLGFNPLGESAALWMERRFPDDNWREPTQAPRPSA